MYNNGFSERVRNWFRYYNKRYQQVKINNVSSEVSNVHHGAAQGTVLGPIIFILYFDAISQQISKCKVSMFADNCIIHQTGNTWDSVHIVRNIRYKHYIP